jgi:hypothetical protein
MLVYFRGRGDWFIKTASSYQYGLLTPHNYLFKVPDTGEIISTNEFGRFYDFIDERRCAEFVGVFRLRKEDIAIYLDSKNLDHVDVLLPCIHEYGGFSISVESGYLSDNLFDECFFWIQKEIDMSRFEHKSISIPPYVISNKLSVFNEIEADNLGVDKFLNLQSFGKENTEEVVCPKNSKKRYETEIASMVRDAVNKLSTNNDGRSLKGTKVSEYVLGDNFSHGNISTKTNDKAIRLRKIELSGSGKVIGFEQIYKCYGQTISKK